MATGTGNLPNPSMSFSPFAILTAEEMNNILENINALADGTGIGDGSVGTSDLANLAVTTGKLAAASVANAKLDFANINFGNYLNTEVDTGFKWINGKNIFKKTINLGTLPNSASTSTAHGITGMTAVVEYRGIGMNLGGMQFIDFQQGNGINTFIDATNVNIATTISRSSFTGYMTLWYTK